jgi:hypothetical protein
MANILAFSPDGQSGLSAELELENDNILINLEGPGPYISIRNIR